MELLHLSARLSSPDLLEASEGRSEERKQSVFSFGAGCHRPLLSTTSPGGGVLASVLVTHRSRGILVRMVRALATFQPSHSSCS